jgi:hypothetical protein
MRSWSLVVFVAGVGLAGQLSGQSERVASLAEAPKPASPNGTEPYDVRFQQPYRFVAVACGGDCPAEGVSLTNGSDSDGLSDSVFEGHAVAGGAASPTFQSESAEDNFYRQDSPGTRYKASSYVRIDSWIYPAFDRLEALGYIETGTASIRPLTRLELARLLAEAHETRDRGNLADEDLFAALDREFVHETGVIDGASNTDAVVESVYSRTDGIAGTPLRDGFHFGQTVVDDYGRPYGQGMNAIDGASGHAEAGPFAVYLRGEYQYGSAITPYSAAVDQAISIGDQNSEAFQTTGGVSLPGNWDMRVGTTNRPRPIEAYAAMSVANWQISFGQQSLWWGPDRTTSLMLSNNAEAMPMLRFARVMPAKLPFLGWLGPVHFDSFFARQGGIHYVSLGPTFQLYGSPNQPLTPPPYLWGVTFSFEPTKNLELGFGHTTIFAGYGRPLNLRTFFHSFSIFGNGQTIDPGKRVTEFNLYYHVPWLRKTLVVYTEGMAWDDPVEGSFFSRFAMDPGFYLTHVPKVKKLDLRVEGVYTNLPGLKDPAYFYSNAHYPQGYTNYGQILGSWVGRQGSGGTATSTYWFSARTKAAVSYRKMIADKSLLQGGNLNDFSGSLTWQVRPGVEVSGTEQVERWRFPLLADGPKSNATTSFEVRFFPKDRR